jgi:DNA-binding NarL/FixJ family response regulator
LARLAVGAEELASAIRKVVAGRRVIDPALAAEALATWPSHLPAPSATPRPRNRVEAVRTARL